MRNTSYLTFTIDEVEDAALWRELTRLTSEERNTFVTRTLLAALRQDGQEGEKSRPTATFAERVKREEWQEVPTRILPEAEVKVSVQEELPFVPNSRGKQDKKEKEGGLPFLLSSVVEEEDDQDLLDFFRRQKSNIESV